MNGTVSGVGIDMSSAGRQTAEQTHITVENFDTVEQALSNTEAGIEFVDALHHASYRSCDSVATCDDRKSVRRAKKLVLAPVVTVLPKRTVRARKAIRRAQPLQRALPRPRPTPTRRCPSIGRLVRALSIRSQDSHPRLARRPVSCNYWLVIDKLKRNPCPPALPSAPTSKTS